MSSAFKRQLVEPRHPQIPISRQCELLALPRSSYYRPMSTESLLNLELMKLIDEEYTRHPFYGSRRIAAWLQNAGYDVNRKRVQRLMRKMGIEALYPKRNLSKAANGHKVYPYLLRGVKIMQPNQVWSTDITYIRMQNGFIYLTAVIDWFSRFVLSWGLSNSLDSEFCLEALEMAMAKGKPKIFNTDQGAQYTSKAFTGVLENAGISISMDGRGRALDNVFVERLWRTVKYEEVYLKNYETVSEAYCSLDKYFTFYNEQRLHQALDYRKPIEAYGIT